MQSDMSWWNRPPSDAESDHDGPHGSNVDARADAGERNDDHARERNRVVVPPFVEVFRTYSVFVWRVLLRLGVAEADVDDIAQEVFLGVHRNLHNFEGRCTLRTWIYAICHRRAVDYRRRANVRPDLYADEPPEQSVEAGQEQGVAATQERERLRRALDQLDDDKRTVFVLFDIEGIPMEEVAEIVGCPLQTGYSRLYAARRKLEAALSRARVEGRSA